MNKNISLVLSGGGARGIAHIGVIEVLEERGYQICEIVGTSMGSLVGGVYALGQMQAYKEWLCGLDRMKVFSLVDFTFGGGGFIKGDRVLGAMREFISDRPIEDLSIPYAAVAVDILNRKEVVFREGSIYDAIRASIAIPTVLTPVEVPGGLLIDGGVLNNLPLSHVEGGDNQPIVAVNVNANIPLEKPDLPRQESEDRESGYQEKIRQFYQQLFGTKAEEAN
ncbi:MAG: phospholipase, partial [Bacteroidetes bacterium]